MQEAIVRMCYQGPGTSHHFGVAVTNGWRKQCSLKGFLKGNFRGTLFDSLQFVFWVCWKVLLNAFVNYLKTVSEAFKLCLFLWHIWYCLRLLIQPLGMQPHNAGFLSYWHLAGCHSDRHKKHYFRNVALLQLKCILKRDQISSYSLCFI